MTTITARLLDLQQTAAYLGWSYMRVYSLIQRGGLKVVRFPNHRRLFIDRVDLDRFIEAHKETVQP